MASLSLDEVLRAVEALRSDMQGQIDELKAALAAVQVGQPVSGAAALAAPVGQPAPGGPSPEISSEVLVILAAAATTSSARRYACAQPKCCRPLMRSSIRGRSTAAFSSRHPITCGADASGEVSAGCPLGQSHSRGVSGLEATDRNRRKDL